MQMQQREIIVNDCKQDGSGVWRVPIRERMRVFGKFRRRIWPGCAGWA